MPYLTRVADSILLDYLEVFGGVLVEGPRECGKTSTSLQHARSSVRLDESPQLQELAHLDPSAILRGESPRLIDEWQLAPTLWNVARHEIDNRQARGQFILSGSASPDDDTTRHSGAARFGRLRMRTMALAESHRSSAAISLAMLHQIDKVSAQSQMSYADMAAESVRGGWPALLAATGRQAVLFNRSYLEDLTLGEIHLATPTHSRLGCILSRWQLSPREAETTTTKPRKLLEPPVFDRGFE